MRRKNEKVEEFVDAIESPNILIIGRTGVGKSALINKVFGSDIAPVSHATSVTDSFTAYTSTSDNGVPITLYDSAGFEAGKSQEFLQETFAFLDEKKAKGKEEQIHIAWYVVNASSARFLDFEADILKRLYADKVPIIIVLSQGDIAKDEEIEDITEKINSYKFEGVYKIIEVAASPLLKRGRPVCDAYGLDDLVDETIHRLPEAYVDAFIAAQMIDIQAKRKVALTYISGAALTCFGAGYLPLPFTTTAATLISQRQLGHRLASLYDYDDLTGLSALSNDISTSKDSFIILISTGVADLWVGEPVTSTIAGLSGATFIAVTGLAFLSTFEELAKKELRGSTRQDIEDALRTVFWERFKSYRENINITSQKDLRNLGDKYLG